MTKHYSNSATLRHGARLSNRLVQPPMQTFSGRDHGHITDQTIDYYQFRSQSAGMIITEYHYVSENEGSCTDSRVPEQLAIYSDDHIEGAQKIAQAIKKDGNKAIMQIHHGGRQATLRARQGKTVYGPSAVDFEFLDYPVEALSEEDIQAIIKDFGQATRRAIEAGFDGVEIHGANHYLIQQFFSSYSNRRQDQWGGSFENRSRFAHEVSKEVTAVAKDLGPDDFIVGYRISPEESHVDNFSYDYKESVQLIKDLQQYEFDYVHLSIFGCYDVRPQESDRSFGDLFSEVLDSDTVLIIIGSVFTEEEVQDALNHGDLVAAARATLLNPQFAKTLVDGRGEELNTKMTPAIFEDLHWPDGLLEAYQTRTDLMPIAGIEQI